MRNEFKKKTQIELEVIVQESPPNSGLCQRAKQEIDRRNFWKKDIISWVSLIFGALALVLHILKYING